MSDRSRGGSGSVSDASLDERLRAVERTLTDTDRDLTAIADAAERTDRIERLEDRSDRLQHRLEELESAVESVRGYVGQIKAVNREVERRANAALAATQGVADDSDLSANGHDPDSGFECVSRTDDQPEENGSDAGTADPSGSDDSAFSRGVAEPASTGDRARAQPPGSPTDDPGPESRQAPDTAIGGPSDTGTQRSQTGERDSPSGGVGTGPVDLGWKPVSRTDDTGIVSDADRANDRPDRVRAGTDPGVDRQPPRGDSDGRGDAASGTPTGKSTGGRVSKSDGRRVNGSDGNNGRRSGHGRANRLNSQRSPGSDPTHPQLEWPPGDGLDVDRAQPWSAPDLPPSDAPDDDRSLLERLREAL